MKQSFSRRSFLTKSAIASAGVFGAATALSDTFGMTYTNKIDDQPKLSAPSDLKITDTQVGIIGGSLFVKIHSDQGIYGCGEGVDAIRGAESIA